MTNFNVFNLVKTLQKVIDGGFGDANVYIVLPDGTQAKIKKCTLEVGETDDILIEPEV